MTENAQVLLEEGEWVNYKISYIGLLQQRP